MKQMFLLIGCILAIGNCKRDSDVLATFENGKVLRSDIRAFYDMKEIPLNPNTTSIQNQTAIVEDLSMQMISEMEFKKNNPNSNPKFQNILEVVEKQLVASIWKKKFLENKKKNSEIELALAQLIVVKKTNPIEAGKSKSEKALNDLKAMKSDKEIFDYIANSTEEESRKPLGGLLEPHCTNCGKDPVTEILFGNFQESQKGQFFLKEVDGNYYIVRILEIKKIKPDKLESYYQKKFDEFKTLAEKYKISAKTEDEKKYAAYYGEEKTAEKAKMTAEHVVRQYENFNWSEEYSRLKNESGITLSKSLLPQNKEVDNSMNPETVLFTRKDNSVYTLRDLESYYEKVNIFKRKGNFPKKEELKEKFAFFHQVALPSFVLTDKNEARDIRNSEKYKKNLDFVRRSIAFALIQSEIQNKDYTISEKELKDNYEVGKMYAYSTPSKSDPKKKEPLPFQSVRDRILQDVENSKKKAEFDKIISGFKNSYNLKLFPDRIEAGRI